MTTASLELSKTLYELTDWDDEDLYHDEGYISGALIPFYDLGYLLRKLPQNVGRITLKHREHSGMWYAKWDNHKIEFGAEADTPEDAACKLAIELIKQGIIQPREGLK